jgi:hypothetical protein
MTSRRRATNAADSGGTANEIAKLASLRNAGTISESEFEAHVAKLLT